jgi:hypothetical protein
MLSLLLVTLKRRIFALPNSQTDLVDKKHIVSIRLNNDDRAGIRTTAARLMVRESELYRFAVCHLLNRLHKLHDDASIGSDLIPLFLEFREEFNNQLSLKKHQLFKIFNGRNPPQNKFVAMADIELVLLPQHSVRQRLHAIQEAAIHKEASTEVWLKSYLYFKYQLDSNISNQDNQQPGMMNHNSNPAPDLTADSNPL